MGRIYFDHTFTVDKSHKFLMDLESRGFSLEKKEVEHPGRAHCRFIKFQSSSPRKMSYLEFVWVKAKKQKYKVPGISFGVSKNLEKFFKTIKDKIPSQFHHKNYEWKKDSKSRLPGWNFLSFKNLPITSYFPWLTEYEKHPVRKKQNLKAPHHKNSAYRVIGAEFLINKKGERFYKSLLAKQVKEKTRLSDGFCLYFKKAKVNKYKLVALACKSMKTFKKHARPDEMTTFQGKEAALLKNPGKGWDIIVIEA